MKTNKDGYSSLISFFSFAIVKHTSTRQSMKIVHLNEHLQTMFIDCRMYFVNIREMYGYSTIVWFLVRFLFEIRVFNNQNLCYKKELNGNIVVSVYFFLF